MESIGGGKPPKRAFRGTLSLTSEEKSNRVVADTQITLYRSKSLNHEGA